ncbi:MAG: sigma 54-interacting transcriptional regulator [Pseudomonadota bacterium]
MPEQKRLNSEDREFFITVKTASLSNPFSEKRIVLDQTISGTGSHQIDETVNAVEQRIEMLERNPQIDLKSLSDPDRNLIEAAHLFIFFYRFRKKFDRFIEEQLTAEDKTFLAPFTGDGVSVPFAGEGISFLLKRGFKTESIQKAFEESYQLRRAFFFIDRNLIGRSPAMKKLRYDLWNNIFTHDIDLYRRYLWNKMEDFSTLILGKTGTGKGAAAAAIGRSGFIPFDMKKQRFVHNFTKSFISINLSQFPETLIESELFGHKKGSFTGATENHKGVFERCSPLGSILLDEIGEVSLPIQIKLLQVLQERIFYPVGSHKAEKFNGRVIAATNRSVAELRKNNTFRDDFYYRLCSDIIMIPSLQQRIQEDPKELNDLLDLIIERTVGEPSKELAGMVRAVIDKRLGMDYPWPGNVRELEQCVRRVLLKKEYCGDHLPDSPDLNVRLIQGIEQGDISAQNLLSGYCKILYNRYGTFEEVSRRTKLDRRTVNKYIREWSEDTQEDD